MSFPGGGYPDFLIASNYAPANVKNRADAICPGSHDDLYIMDIIDSLPTAPPYTRHGQNETGGKIGALQLSGWQFCESAPLIIPFGSIIQLRGAGVSSWTPVGTVTSTYNGGTQIYSTDPGGNVFSAGKNANNFPTIGLQLENIENVIQNPVGTGTINNVASTDLSGMVTGLVRNVNTLCDTSLNSTRRIANGVSLACGAASDRKFVSAMAAFGFHTNGFIINTSHLIAEQLSATNISGDTYAKCFNITANEDNFFAGLHAFSGTIGLGSSYSSFPLAIQSMHFESLTTALAVNVGGTPPAWSVVHIKKADIDGTALWSGDIANPAKCRVDVVALNPTTGPTPLTSNFGTVTIPAGSTSITFNPGLFAPPTRIDQPTQTDAFGAGAYVSPGATGSAMTINIPAPQPSPANLGWSAKV